MKPVIDPFKGEGKPFKMGMAFPVPKRNYELRYWLDPGVILLWYHTPEKGDIKGQIDAVALIEKGLAFEPCIIYKDVTYEVFTGKKTVKELSGTCIFGISCACDGLTQCTHEPTDTDKPLFPDITIPL